MYAFLTGFEFVRFNARLQGLADPDAAAARAIRTVDLEAAQARAVGDLLEGDAPARQGRRGARPRPAGAPARRAVQRHGPAPAAAHDGAAHVDGGRGPGGPVLVAHPRGGRAARPERARHPCRPPRGVGQLPRDPPAHDRPAAYVHGPLERRPPARRRARGGPAGLRGRAHRRPALGPLVGLRRVHPLDRARRPGVGRPAVRAAARPTSRSRACSTTWCARSPEAAGDRGGRRDGPDRRDARGHRPRARQPPADAADAPARLGCPC